VEEPEREIKNKPFGLQDLKKYWQDFADLKKAEGKKNDHILLNEDILLLEDYIIEIKLSNPVQEEFLNGLKTELLIFLRGKLENELITITSAIKAADEKKRPYTPKEKLEHMIEKQPLLKELKDRLGLDPDF
jgi:DNA polymerase III subunit gamma/tau